MKKKKELKIVKHTFEGERLRDTINELNSKIFDLERELFESQAFEKIASDKLTVWVKKHDELLFKYKELLKNNEPKA